jgi:cation:H+ antiporter
MEYFYVAAGLVCLFFGGDWLVKGAIALSAKMGLPAFLISLTVVGFGTSMPELLVSVRAALDNAPGIALGNVVGSNIANILLIIGLAGLIAPMSPTNGNSKRDLIIMLLAAAMLVAILFTGNIGLSFGLGMLAALLAYLTLAYFQDRQIGAGEIEENVRNTSPSMIGILLFAGLAFLAGGADFLVRGATVVAVDLGVSNAVIGLTVVAVGTSLPELATSITAALKRQSDIAIGNVIGSNIFNILGILGITALIAPIPVAERFVSIDGWVMLGVTTILFAILFLGHGINRITGALFLVGYAGYMVTMA